MLKSRCVSKSFIFIAIINLFLFSCPQPQDIVHPEVITHTVHFEVYGGEPVPADREVAHGEKVVEPAAMLKEGFDFGGWYKDAGFVSVWDYLSDVVVEDTTIFAKWTPKDIVINIPSIQGVIVPVTGEIPVEVVSETAQYTGSVTWSPAVNDVFLGSIKYTAVITLTPKSGFTLDGVASNFFTVQGAEKVSNSANSGTVTAEFPETDPDDVLVSVVVKKLPNKLYYKFLEDFDPEGMVVVGVYSNSGEVEIFDYTVSGFFSWQVGSRIIVVSYDGKDADGFLVIVEQAAHKVTINGAADNNTVKVGKTLTADVFDDGLGLDNISYQWKRDGPQVNDYENIIGANAPEYLVTTEDETYSVIRIEVTWNKYNVTSYADVFPVQYAIGEIGPAGGKIAYRSNTLFPHPITGELCLYIEAAPSDFSEEKRWASSEGYANIFITGASGTAIGTGASNTAAILAIDPDAPAARA